MPSAAGSEAHNGEVQVGGAALAGLFARIADSRFASYLVLLVLALAVFVPGVLRLPAVDRTEIVFADTTREMVARGAWMDPRYGEAVHQFRPIGTFWAQGVAATIAGSGGARDISVYRWPSLAAVVLTVLALFALAAPRVGRRTALLAAGLFAVAPLTVLVSQLAIADGLALLPATVAMLSLLRLYDSEPDVPTVRLALLFWVAMGSGMLVNALHTPILVGVTLLALFAFDRDLTWLRRTRPLTGLPIALVLGAPWLAVRVLQDGVPFAGQGWHEFLAALGGAQDMKLRAFPGTFLAAALLGFLPGVALLPAAMTALWGDRGARLPRFLLAWTIGYLAYLELLSSKPGTYTVQVMYPAFALAVAMLAMDRRGASGPPKWAMIPWPPVAAAFALVLFGAVYGFVREWPSPLAAAMIAGVAALFGWSAKLGRGGDLAGWGLAGIGALALFAITLLGIVFPGVRAIWPAREMATAVSVACGPGPMAVLGFREPSASFVLGQPKVPYTPETMPREPGTVHLVESRWLDRYLSAQAASGVAPVQLGCVAAFNTMRGCPLTFTILAADPRARRCVADPGLACSATVDQVRPSSRGCD